MRGVLESISNQVFQARQEGGMGCCPLFGCGRAHPAVCWVASMRPVGVSAVSVVAIAFWACGAVRSGTWHRPGAGE